MKIRNGKKKDNDLTTKDTKWERRDKADKETDKRISHRFHR